ncbi:DUF551 domain-containing protein [Raoultella ornithinolytica]|uniref:DUF551 domain-containing protein n=1 Tax=Raoultella ornithinolytica TaxID=54291 RepID=UPI00384EF993
MSDEIETIDKNPKSWAAWKREAERLQAIIDDMALAAMDSEPVAWDYEWASCITCEGPQNFNRVIEREAPPDWSIEEGQAKNIIPLYRHAQPAPVVPNGLRLALSNAGIAAPESDEMLAATCEKHIQALVTWVKDRKPFQSAPVVPSFEEWLSAANRKPLGWVKDAMREAYDACRAAMLQAGNSPVIPDGSTAGMFNSARALLDALYEFGPDEIAISEHVTNLEDALRNAAAMLQAGNSPVIPDGLIAAVNRLLDSDGSRGCYSAIQCGDAHDEIERLLAAAPHDTPALNSVQSVVTVPGKWIPVSERVPETDGNYWGWWSESKRQGPVWFIKSELQAQFQSHEITHWMPLPAAPQEVKGE